MTIVSQVFDHVIGVDTHAKTHTLVVVSAAGTTLAQAVFPTHPAGLARAHAWMLREAPGRVLAAIEGTGSYGAQLADLLSREGVEVAEMRPPRKGARREGKTDLIDAEIAARTALALPIERAITPRTHTGDHAALSVLLTARKALSKTRTAAINRLTALLRAHNLGLDVRASLTAAQTLQLSRSRPRSSDSSGLATIRAEAVRQAHEIVRRDQELHQNEKGLRKHVTALAPWLLDERGVGPFVAAELLVSWSHKGRIRSEAAFARLAGSAPIPASSGNTSRHRLHRGGDRQLNRALWTVAFNRYYSDPATMEYVAKRTKEGKSDRDIFRSLKRYLARSFYRKLSTKMA